MVDSKTYSFPNRHRGEVAAGEPVHEMWLRLTVDDSMRIHEVEAATDYAPFGTCPAITDNFKRLEGLTIGPGFRRAVRARVGGAQGCTHLVELVRPDRHDSRVSDDDRPPNRHKEPQEPGGHRVRSARPSSSTCHALASDGPVVRERWPELYTGGG